MSNITKGRILAVIAQKYQFPSKCIELRKVRGRYYWEGELPSMFSECKTEASAINDLDLEAWIHDFDARLSAYNNGTGDLLMDFYKAFYRGDKQDTINELLQLTGADLAKIEHNGSTGYALQVGYFISPLSPSQEALDYWCFRHYDSCYRMGKDANLPSDWTMRDMPRWA